MPISIGCDWIKGLFYPNLKTFGQLLSDFPLRWATQSSFTITELVEWCWTLAADFETRLLNGSLKTDSPRFTDDIFGSIEFFDDDVRFARYDSSSPCKLVIGPTADWGTWVLRGNRKIRHENCEPADVRELDQDFRPWFHEDTEYKKQKPHIPTPSIPSRLALPVFVDEWWKQLIFYPSPKTFGSSRSEMIDKWQNMTTQQLEPLFNWFWNVARQYAMLRQYTNYQGNGPLVYHADFGEAYVVDDDEGDDDEEEKENVTIEAWESRLQIEAGLAIHEGTYLLDVSAQKTYYVGDEKDENEDDDDEGDESDEETNE